ncbi:hypothetical protein MMC16_006831 [Acarospora aff. strigata]|nr:hypothetical protein [Acarospora aff. strigata]
MPRQRRGAAAPARSAPTRPTAAPARPHVTPPQPQHRPSSTAAHPPATTQQAHPPAAQQAQGKSPGMFGQMASTAAGVAVGSSIGHAIGGFFGGGSSSAAPAEAEQGNVNAAPTNAYGDQAAGGNSWGAARNCEVDAKQFTKCLDENGGNMQICGWYLDQLKACQAAASQY